MSPLTTGTFTDERDGKIYKWVKIGNQTWMAENLQFKAVGGRDKQGFWISKNCWAYNNKEENATHYGYLYDWETACQIAPRGWHLPSKLEWEALIDFLGGKSEAGKKMKSSTDWESPNDNNNSSGFSALPVGCRLIEDKEFTELGISGYWTSSGFVIGPDWKLQSYRYTSAWMYEFNYYDVNIQKSSSNKKNGFSVRCVRND